MTTAAPLKPSTPTPWRSFTLILAPFLAIALALLLTPILQGAWLVIVFFAAAWLFPLPQQLPFLPTFLITTAWLVCGLYAFLLRRQASEMSAPARMCIRFLRALFNIPLVLMVATIMAILFMLLVFILSRFSFTG